jgi:hypothetical protein
VLVKIAKLAHLLYNNRLEQWAKKQVWLDKLLKIERGKENTNVKN